MTKQLYKCPRCGEITEIIEKDSSVRAGDNGFRREKIISMKCCGFTPFILPKPYEGEK